MKKIKIELIFKKSPKPFCEFRLQCLLIIAIWGMFSRFSLDLLRTVMVICVKSRAILDTLAIG